MCDGVASEMRRVRCGVHVRGVLESKEMLGWRGWVGGWVCGDES